MIDSITFSESFLKEMIQNLLFEGPDTQYFEMLINRIIDNKDIYKWFDVRKHDQVEVSKLKRLMIRIIELKDKGVEGLHILEMLKDDNVEGLELIDTQELMNLIKKQKSFLKVLEDKIKKIITYNTIENITNLLVGQQQKNEVNSDEIIKQFNQQINNFIEQLLETVVVNNSFEISSEKVKQIEGDLDDFLGINSFKKEMEIISTGYPTIDSLISDGLQKGRTYIILGKTGFGKSSFLINLVKNFLKQGKSVLFYTLENTLQETKQRLFQSISEVPMQDLYKRKDEVIEKIREFFLEGRGYLDIEYVSSDVLTVEMIKRYVQMKESQGKYFDIIIIDYVDLMKLPSKQENERIRITKLMRRLKHLQQETNTIVITPSQVHRQVFRSKRVEIDNVQESWGKIQEQDGVFILEQNQEELLNNTVRINIGKMRHGKSNVRVLFNVNFDIMKFEDTGKIVKLNEKFDDIEQVEDEQDDLDELFK